MKKIILFALISFVFGSFAKSQTTYTSPNTSTTVTITDATGWNALPWVPTGGGAPKIFIISPLYTILVGPGGGNTVDLTGEANLTLTVQGKLGFYNGNNDLQLAATATVNIAAGGEIGYVSTGGCCSGNSSNNLVIGATNMSGPFSFVGPDQAVSGTPLTYSTHWITNAGSADWNTAGNWSNGVPSSTKNAFITDATTFDPIITINNAATSKLVVLANGLLTINSGGGVTVSDALDNSGTIVVKTGGSLVQTITSSLTNTGTFNVESTIPGGVQFIGSPINNIAANGFGITPTGTNGGQIIPQAICSPTAIATGSPYGNLLELRENPAVLSNCAQSLWHVKSSGTLEEGRGYSLSNATTTLVYTGTVNNGTVTFDDGGAGLTRQAGTIGQQDGTNTTTRGWHLVSNPYPSPITITAAMLTANFDEQVALYQDMGTPYNGTWKTFSSAGPDFLPVTVAVGQAFQIRNKTIGTSPNFVLNNSCRAVANPTFYKIMQFDYLKIALSNGTMADTTSIYFSSGATDNFDPSFDASRMIDGIQRPMIYSVVNNEQLSTNGLPVMNANDTKTVSISIRTEVHGAHTLTFTGVNTIGVDVFLKDLKLNTLQPVSEGYVYNFTTVAGDNRNRFELHLAADASTGISASNNSNFKVFPNPATGTTSLYLGTNHGFSNAAVTDVCGKTFQAYTLNENDSVKTLDLNGLNAGIYFIKLSGTSDASVIKLIKQ